MPTQEKPLPSMATAKAEALQRVHRLADTHVKAFGADKEGLYALRDACFNIPYVTAIDIGYYWGISLIAQGGAE